MAITNNNDLVQQPTKFPKRQIDDSNFNIIPQAETDKFNMDSIPEKYSSFGKSAAAKHKRCDKINVVVTNFGRLGASVTVLEESVGVETNEVENPKRRQQFSSVTGLILNHELDYWKVLHEREPNVGEMLTAYVQNTRLDGKLDITLRPIGYDKVTEARNQLMTYLENPLSNTPGSLPLGDKSTPEQIWSIFPGLSKGQFKSAVGLLLREGAIVTSPDTLQLVPVSDRKPMAALPYSGKSPKGWRPPADCTLFLGNLPFTVDDMEVAAAVEAVIGTGKLASVKVSKDADSGESRGFGHLEFFEANFAEEALTKLRGLKVDGRPVRIDRKRRADEISSTVSTRKPSPSDATSWKQSKDQKPYEKRTSSSPSTTPISNGNRDRKKDTSEVDMKSWCTVYVGELPYKITDETLKYVIESSLSKGKGSVAAVRQAVNKDTGLKRGFGYVDFYDADSAERAVKELNGMNVMGRAIKMDLEGLKKRAKDTK
eukprot:CAMPEP_0170063866 /NCGR_PEP_ID=MMETSP0019_2-20121128/4575_1 /TAXON_ID=98059 /ORGANISM="Dinobryon sp., Strain UTEXLB2267" /LENGTH=484 /DNA_ID=CAMNT_0010270407 /DNA_START=61 /DNA_END=1515 /DNA_ORIENTATION=-